jgi:peptidyl-prolyl cis-trans isomerase B (cyclophilin B)
VPQPATPKRRLTWLWISLAAIALVATSGVGWILVGSRDTDAPGAVPGAVPGTGSVVANPSGAGTAANGPAAAAGATCTYVPAPEGAPQERKPPIPPPRASVSGAIRVTVSTNLGTITLRLAADAAPCAANSFVSLARSRYYDSTPCHRLTTRGIYVLQCGDPSGSGTGGPGYQYADENLPIDRHPAYPRGTIAMANAGPNTNGSQFFLVFKDSEIDPNYTVVGTIAGGLEVLDKVAEAGTDNSGGTGDGQPKLAVTINSVTVEG